VRAPRMAMRCAASWDARYVPSVEVFKGGALEVNP